MTFQEVLWQNTYVVVTGLLSKSGKYHRYVKPFVGRGGWVSREAKNGMLLVGFSQLVYNKDGKLVAKLEKRAIPAGCLTKAVDLRLAGKKWGKKRKEPVYNKSALWYNYSMIYQTGSEMGQLITLEDLDQIDAEISNFEPYWTADELIEYEDWLQQQSDSYNDPVINQF